MRSAVSLLSRASSQERKVGAADRKFLDIDRVVTIKICLWTLARSLIDVGSLQWCDLSGLGYDSY